MIMMQLIQDRQSIVVNHTVIESDRNYKLTQYRSIKYINRSKNLFEKSAQSFVDRSFDGLEAFCLKSIPGKGSKRLFKQVLRQSV
jgi:hypothetical protein